MQARGQTMLLLPDLSLAEQSPDLTDVYLRQTIFTVIRSYEFISPLHVYLAQYRQMALDNLIGTVPDDVAILKRYDWYVRRDPTLHMGTTAGQQEEEFKMFINLRSFGETRFVVRFHTTDTEGRHRPDAARTLVISNRYVAVFDQYKSQEVMKGRPFDTIKHLGVKNSELRFTFEDNHEWYILYHRACEISYIVQMLMQRRHVFRPVSEVKAASVPTSEVLSLPDPITCPKSRVSAEDLLPDLFGRVVKSYAKLAQKRTKGEIDSEYAMQELVFNSQLHKLEDVARSCKCVDGELVATTVACLDLAPFIDSPAPKMAPLSALEPIAKDLKEINRRLFGSDYSGIGRDRFKRNLEILESVSSKNLHIPQKSAITQPNTPSDLTPQIQQLEKELMKLANSDGPIQNSDTWERIRTISSQLSQSTNPLIESLTQEDSIANLAAAVAANESERRTIVGQLAKDLAAATGVSIPEINESQVIVPITVDLPTLPHVPVETTKQNEVATPIIEEPESDTELPTNDVQTPERKTPEMDYTVNSMPIPQPMMYSPGPCQPMFYGYQPMPMYSPGYAMPFQTPPASPSTTRIDASPNIIVNVGQKSRNRKRMSRNAKRLVMSSESESESDFESESESESEAPVDIDEMFARMDMIVDELARVLRTGRNPKRKLQELASIAKSMEIVCEDEDEDVLKLVKRVRKFAKVDGHRGQQEESLMVISREIERVCQKRRVEMTRRVANNPKDLLIEGSGKARPKAEEGPCLTEALQKLQASLSRAHVQAAATTQAIQ